jgi:hypothetical protein
MTDTAQPFSESAGFGAFMSQSRFKCVGLVIDLQVEDIGSIEHLENIDARRALALARELKAPYVVLAGQLHRKDAGVFARVIPRDDIGALCGAAVSAYARLGEMGESHSMWFVLGEKVREPVMAALAEASATEGNA